MIPRVEGARYRSVLRFLYESLEGLVLVVPVVLTWPITQRWLGNWGSTREERGAEWPGDAYVSSAEITNTRGLTISAPPERVWPWLVQFGLDRAGFYSYELFERLVGIPVRNVESILPQFQTMAVGEEVFLHPSAPGVPVAEVLPDRRLCLGVSPELEDRFERPSPERSWSMYLVAQDGGSTRLILRSCIGPLAAPTLGARLGRMVEESIDFLMEQRMLRSVRRLAERPGTAGSPTVAA